jgi:hypothetical protein
MLSPPESAGDSKLGEAANRILADCESLKVIVNRAESAPPEIVIVADSDARIIATLVEIETFSTVEKDVAEVIVGAVLSKL